MEAKVKTACRFVEQIANDGFESFRGVTMVQWFFECLEGSDLLGYMNEEGQILREVKLKDLGNRFWYGRKEVKEGYWVEVVTDLFAWYMCSGQLLHEGGAYQVSKLEKAWIVLEERLTLAGHAYMPIRQSYFRTWARKVTRDPDLLNYYDGIRRRILEVAEEGGRVKAESFQVFQNK
jgi:hypothetical protein